MSFNRDKATDRVNTLHQLRSRDPIEGARNWLGHLRNRGTAKLDGLLLNGATTEELKATRGAVHEHIYHLRKEHGLRIIRAGDKYKITS